jgi:hypothetical protein
MMTAAAGTRMAMLTDGGGHIVCESRKKTDGYQRGESVTSVTMFENARGVCLAVVGVFVVRWRRKKEVGARLRQKILIISPRAVNVR